MANNTQDVELRIRATNYSRKTTREVVDDLKDLVKAQEEQRKAAERGEASVGDLEKSYERMASAVRALVAQDALIKFFELQSQKLAETEARLTAARKAQADYAASLDPAAKRTKAQTAELARLAREVSSAENAMTRISNSVASTTGRLERFGISTANIADSQREIAQAVSQANNSLAAQEAAIDGADAAARSRREAQARLDERHAQVRAETIFNNAVRAAAAAQEAEARAARENAEANAMRNAAHDAEMEALFTREANRRTEALQRQAAALRQAADAAERNMRASGSAARPGATVSTSNLQQQLSNIADPAAAARTTVTGLTDAMSALERRVATMAGPVRDYRGAVQEAAAAQRGLQQIAGNIDAYNRQLAALRAARTEYTQARAAVAALVAELRSGNAGDDISTRLRNAQNTLERAAQNMNTLTQRTRDTRNELRAAGVDTRNLAAAEAELTSQATRGAQAMNTLTQQVQRYGQAANGAADGTRQTLSWAQRMRGELLSLTAGYVGLNAAIELGRKVIDAYNTNQAILSRLTVTTNGDVKAATQEFNWLTQAADRIGFSFQKLAPAYAKFAIAAKAAGWETQQTRFAFEQIAKAGTAARLSTDELEGVFKALEQMLSKGAIQAEELKGQLGDRLPGAFQIAAKSIGVTVEQLTKMLEAGEVTSDYVLNVARGIGQAYAVIGNSTETLNQAQARFDNATQRFFNDVANGGFVEAYQGLLNRLTTFMNDGSAGRLANALATGFTLAIDAIQAVVDNLEALKVVIGIILGMKFIGFLTTLPALFTACIAPVVTWNAQMLALNAQLGAFTTASAIAGTSATGFAGLMARLAPAITAVGSALLFVARALPVIGAAVAAYAVTTAILDKLDENVRNKVNTAMKATDKAVADAEKAADARDKARGTAKEKEAQEHYDKMRAIAVNAIKAQDAAVQTAKDKGVDLSGIVNQRAAAKATATGETADPGDNNSEIGRLKALKKDLAKEDKKLDEAINSQRLKSAKEQLAERLKIVDEEWEERRQKARNGIKDEALLGEALAEIDKRANKARQAETMKFNNERHKENQAAGDKRIRLAEDIKAKLKDAEDDLARRQAEVNVAEPYEKRRAAAVEDVKHAYEDLYKLIRSQEKVDPKNAGAAKAAVDAIVAQRQALQGQISDRNEAVRLQGEMNKQLDIQKAQVEAINAQEEMGRISAQAAADQRAAVFQEMGPKIEDAGKKALAFAESVKAMLDPVQYAQLIGSINTAMTKNNGDAQMVASYIMSTQKQLNAMLAAEAADRARVNELRKAGAIDSEQEAMMLNQITLQYATSVQTLAEQLLAFVQIAREAGAMSTEDLDKIKASAEAVVFGVQNAKKETSDLNKTFQESILQNGVQGFDAIAQSLAKVALGQQSMAEGFRGIMQAAAQFFASLLKDLAMAIIKTQILKALQASTMFGGGGAAAGAGTAVASGLHTGGLAGWPSNFSRAVSPAVFSMAPRYHSGGLAGLKPDEVPAILQKNEEVLTRDDPRHRLNGGGQDAGGGMRVVLVDDRSRVPEAMNSAEGERVIVQAIRANVPTIKAMLK